MSNLIRVVDVCKSYYEGLTELPVLKGIDLDVQTGEILVIIGASGVGKSTLLHLIGGLDRPTRGAIFYEGQDIFDFNDKRLDQFRNQEVGFVFQFHHLLSEFTTLENVAMAALIAGENSDDGFHRAKDLLDYVGLGSRLTHYPSQLSGGERQRVAIARAVINHPKAVLADEPTGNLDRKTSEVVLELLWDLNKRLGQTLIVVTHNQAIAQRANRHIYLVDGKVSNQVQSGNLPS